MDCLPRFQSLENWEIVAIEKVGKGERRTGSVLNIVTIKNQNCLHVTTEGRELEVPTWVTHPDTWFGGR